MKRLVKLNYSLFIVLFFFNNISLISQINNNAYVLIETTHGNIKIKLYDETPFHKENFLKLVSEKFYNDQIFHRVINNFMIQAGDPKSKNAKPGQPLGYGDLGYTIPAEFNKNLFHKKGALAAARQPDNVNPDKESSASQFYIVHGKVYSNEELDLMEQRGVHIKFTEEQRKIYISVGGTPHLDYSYTVFGEVTEGIDVVDKIASVKTDKRDRPINDIKIKIKIIN